MMVFGKTQQPGLLLKIIQDRLDRSWLVHKVSTDSYMLYFSEELPLQN